MSKQFNVWLTAALVLTLMSGLVACSGQSKDLTGAAVEQPAGDQTNPAAGQDAAGDTAAVEAPPAAETGAEQPAADTGAEQPAVDTGAEQPAVDTGAEQPAVDTPEQQAAADAAAELMAAEAAVGQAADATVGEVAPDAAVGQAAPDAAAGQVADSVPGAVNVAQQSWSVAIEQNQMLTNCGTTTNIPVGGATDCTTAKQAAWNLLMTLFQTPNCMNPGCPLASVTQGVSTCVAQTYTKPNGQQATRWQVSWTWSCAPQPPSCPGNLIANGTFTNTLNVVGNGTMPPSSVANWGMAFGTPQLSALMGNLNPGFIMMWGNQVVGEAVRQTLSSPLVQNAKYRLAASVRWINSPNNPPLPPYVRFKIRASTGPLATYTTPGAVIGTIGQSPSSPPPSGLGITSAAWTHVTLADWTATGAFNTLTINPENALAVNNGNMVSWGAIDNVCLQRVPMPCVLDPGMVSAGNTFARRITLAQTFTPTQNGSLSKITHGLQNISTVTNYDLLVTKTTGGGLPSWTGGTYSTPNVLYSKVGANVFASAAQVNAVVTIPSGQEPYLTAGTKYALVLIPGTPTTGYMAWRGNSSAGSYANGSAYELVGTTWNVPTTGPKDHGFKLEGNCP